MHPRPIIKDPPFLELRPNQHNIARMARMVRLWGTSYLYQSPRAGMFTLAADEIEGWDDRLLAVFGRLSLRELETAISHELTPAPTEH